MLWLRLDQEHGQHEVGEGLVLVLTPVLLLRTLGGFYQTVESPERVDVAAEMCWSAGEWGYLGDEC